MEPFFKKLYEFILQYGFFVYLTIVTLFSFTIAIIFPYGANNYDPFIYGVRINYFRSLGQIDYTKLHISQTEGFYAFYILLSTLTKTDTLFWIRYSVVFTNILFYILLYKIIYLYLGNREQTNKIIPFVLVFIFGISFPVTIAHFQFWSTALSNLFLLIFVLSLYYFIQTEALKKYLIILVPLFSFLSATIHLVTGIITSGAFYFLLLHESVEFLEDRQKNHLFSLFGYLFGFILPIVRLLIPFPSYYSNLLLTFMNELGLLVPLVSLGLIFVFGWNKHIIPFIEWFMNRKRFIFYSVILITLIILILFFPSFFKQLDLLAFGGSLEGQRFTLEPFIFKIPFLFCASIICLEIFICLISKLLIKSHKEHHKHIIFLLLSSYALFIVSFAFKVLGFSHIIYIFRISIYILVFSSIGLIFLIHNQINRNKLIAFFLLLLALSIPGVSLALPNTSLYITEEEVEGLKWAASNIPDSALIFGLTHKHVFRYFDFDVDAYELRIHYLVDIHTYFDAHIKTVATQSTFYNAYYNYSTSTWFYIIDKKEYYREYQTLIDNLPLYGNLSIIFENDYISVLEFDKVIGKY
ncbi:MAG: hypothetical protein ACFFAO_05625 [Candidatus Hermodarchaeota archaeon]